jgi:hypothetical protein
MDTFTDQIELREACLRSYSKYLRQANRSHKLLLAVKKFPPSFGEWRAILEQRLLESDAFLEYLSARAKLLQASREKLFA